MIRLLTALLFVWALSTQAQYIDPRQQTALTWDNPLGPTHSHELPPWRGYLETSPTSHFLDGVGVCLNGPNPDLTAEMLVRHGIIRTRFEIGWGALDYNTGQISARAMSGIGPVLTACKKWHLRPIVLLNSNQAQPCPELLFYRIAGASSPAGSATITLTDTTGLVPGKSGIGQLLYADQYIFKSISGNVCTFTKAFPYPISAGQKILCTTLKYRPFSVPGSQDDLDTLKGWQDYVLSVCGTLNSVLGVGGYDLEIWNELSFGSDFLHINKYDTSFNDYVSNAIVDIVKATADVADANPTIIGPDTRIADGFCNVEPFEASGTEPARINWLSKHLYPITFNFPAMERKGASVNALFQYENHPAFIPNYSTRYPEAWMMGLFAENAVRDLSPITTSLNGVMHGRFARPGNPCPVIITEIGDIGYSPKGPVGSPTDPWGYKTKVALRMYCSYLNKGADVLCWFSAADGFTPGVPNGSAMRLGMVQDNFLQYCETNTAYPLDDRPYTSPPLAALAHVVYQMKYEAFPSAPRQLIIDSVTDVHNHYQFVGDGTAAHPTLYDRDVLAIFPFQGNAHRFVVPFYVMTTNAGINLAQEYFDITLGGLNGATAAVWVYDPILDRYYPTAITRGTTTVTVHVPACDYPYLMILTD